MEREKDFLHTSQCIVCCIVIRKGGRVMDKIDGGPGGGGYSPKIPIRVCAAQQGRDFGTPYLERGIHFRDVS